MTDAIFISLCNNKMQYLNLNSKQLAEMTGINHAALNMVLTERVKPSLPIALKLSQTLSVSLDALSSIEFKRGELN